jgi:hypothetical protein
MRNQSSEMTINATAFKARCLGLMDDLAHGRLKRVLVTKRGKVVAEMGAPAEEIEKTAFLDDGKYPSFWGCMKPLGRKLSSAEWAEIEREAASLHDEWPTPEDLDRNIQIQLGRAG